MTALICVGSFDMELITTGKEYPVIKKQSDGRYVIEDNYGIYRSVPLNGGTWQFNSKEENHTAVSGDQSLFTLLQSPDDHLYVYRGDNNNIFSDSELWTEDYYTLLAERKPVLYVPVIGDKFTVDDSNNVLTCHFIDYNNIVYCHNDKDEVCWYTPKYSKFTKA